MNHENQCPCCKTICPSCGQKGVSRVLYYGFPMRICDKESCSFVYGFWAWVLNIHYDGFFIVYNGNYFKGLWFWLSGKADKGEW